MSSNDSVSQIDTQVEQKTPVIHNRRNYRCMNRAQSFLKKIGLPHRVVPSYIPDPQGVFFPGIWIANSQLHFCPARADAGRVLHDAGHLALMPRDKWPLLGPGEITIEYPFGTLAPLADAVVEAWDYAAGMSVGINPFTLFSADFDGAGHRVWEQFDNGTHPGIPVLKALGMTLKDFPKMVSWYLPADAQARIERVSDLVENYAAIKTICLKPTVSDIKRALKL